MSDMGIVNGYYYDDFEMGKEFVTDGRTITETVVTNFAGVSGDMHPLHTDKEYGKKTVFGKNIAHGLCVLSVVSGLVVKSGILKNAMALFGIQDWKFVNPVFFDDTIRVKIKVFEKKDSSKKDRGTVTLGLEIINQRDEIVQMGKWAIMMIRKDK
jgi:3-hydroxybutyryl-CoA dehydratase